MKADGSFKSLLQGVSQQPVRDRLPGQATEQINMSADPVKGLTRRPGDDLVGSLGSAADTRGWGNLITKDGRKCLVKITGSGVRVFDYNGMEYPVVITGSTSYFTTPGKWSITTLKDKTYLANNAIIVALRSTTQDYSNAGNAPYTRAEGIIQVLGGAYGKTYSITVNDTVVAAFKTVDGSEATHSRWVGTAYIAEVLEWLLANPVSATMPPRIADHVGEVVRTGLLATGYTISRKDDVIRIRRGTTTKFRLTVNDDFSNTNMKAMTDNVADIADLPRYAPHNYVVRVAQETNPDEDLWLRFVSDDVNAISSQGFGDSGAWYETIAPGISKGFLKSTMPRVMTFDPSNQTFTIGEEAWADRTVGTETTNPTPSFVGYGIDDVSSFQSRLILLGGPNLSGSRSKKFEDFWIASASTLVDSDPIDLTSQAAFASSLEYAVPHNKDLVVFSNKGQFVLFGRTAVTPSNAALVLTTSFEADLSTKPVPCGRNIFFCTHYGRFTGLREFYTEGGTDINDTRPITQHVKNYLIGSPVCMAASPNYDILLVQTDGAPDTLYAYQFIWSDTEKVQSAWSKWTFPVNAVNTFFDEEIVYIVTVRGTDHVLVRMSLDVTPEEGVGYPVHLSSKFDVQGVNTAFVLPLDTLAQADLIIVQSTGCPNPGLPIGIESVEYSTIESGWVVTMKDDMLGGSIVVGDRFLSDYYPTMPRMKDKDGVVVSNARLMISQILVALQDTGHMLGQKVTKWGNSWAVPFEGYIVNDVNSNVGEPALTERLFKMPIKERADRTEVHFYTDEHWPMTLLDIEWDGTINVRSKRLTGGAT